MWKVDRRAAVDTVPSVMQAKPLSVIIAGAACGLAVAVTVLAAGLLWESASLRTELASTRSQWLETTRELAALRNQQATVTIEGEARQRELDSLRTELAALRTITLADQPAGPGAFTRARFYSGGRHLGDGWVRTGTGDTSSGATTDVVLDAPATGTPASPAPSGSAAVAAVSQTSWYPSWPWLWTTGWIDYGQPTNAPTPFAPPPGTAPSIPAPPTPAATPQTIAGLVRVTPTARQTLLPSRFPQTTPRPPMVATPSAGATGFRPAPTAPGVRPSPAPAPRLVNRPATPSVTPRR